jgi:EAL domain-containing protein (putative c-di-GMP-specific phosphodiesterase class I)
MIARFATIVLPRTLDTATQPWRMRLSAAGILGTVLVVSLAAGYHIAATRTLQHEAALAEDIGLPFGEMVAAVELDGQQLAQFAEQPCTNIIDGLTEGGELAPYVSSVFFVKDDRVYCSTALGPVDIPLSVYVPPSHAATQVAMRPGTPRHPQRPAMIVYDRLSGHTGIGFVVPGVYVKDLLVSGTVAGAQSAAVIGSSGNALTNDGEFIESASPRVGRPSYSAPDALFSVSVQGVQAWRARDLVADEGAASLIGLLLGSAVVAGYLTVYTPQRRLVRRVLLGLARGEFFVVYQPIVDVATGQWVGAEALVRWQHPQWGLVMPGQFIGHVENSPVIADLTQFVLKRALTELGAMGLPKGFSLTVNLAAFHASLRGFPSDLGEILAASRTRLQVVFEITERGLLASIDDVRDRLATLRSQGARFAVDDFGTENSNLALLQRFHFDYIKIDRRFVHGVVSDDRALVEGIAFLAGQVGALVVAEGVEESAQQRILETIGVPLAQGFLFAKPGRAAEFARGFAASAAH